LRNRVQPCSTRSVFHVATTWIIMVWRWLVLWVEADIGPLEHVMQKSTPRGRPEYSEGSLIRGTAKCGKMEWVEFDGTKLHLRQGDRSHLDQGDAQAHNPNLQGSPAAASKDFKFVQRTTDPCISMHLCLCDLQDNLKGLDR